MIIRWQIGPFGELSWRALEVSIRLMQRMEPEAKMVVVHQGELRSIVSGVSYVLQESCYSHGRFEPPQYEEERVVFMENDHIMWQLPPAWVRWRTSPGVMAWMVDWDYYGHYAEAVGDFRVCPGMYGLPPGPRIPPPPSEEIGNDQAEQGRIAVWLRQHPPHEIVTHDEVRAYNPSHEILGPSHSTFGTHGVHLFGLNRGFNGRASEALNEIEQRFL